MFFPIYYVSMAPSNLLNALIIDPVSESRSTLKGLLQNDKLYHYLVYKGVHLMSTLEEASANVSKSSEIDVVFISLRFPLSEIAEFIRSIKKWDVYQGVAFIFICNTNQEQDRALIAQGVAAGANGFLLFPCSVEQLRSISTIAQRIKVEAHDRMMEHAIRMLIESLVIEIEKKAEILYDDGGFTQYAKHLKGSVKNLLEDEKDRVQFYLDTLLEKTSLSTPRIVLPPKRLPKSKLLQEKLRKREEARRKESQGQ